MPDLYAQHTHNNELQFSTRFSTTFSTILNTIFENIKHYVLLPSFTTIDYEIEFSQDTLRSYIISKRNLCSPSEKLQKHPLFTTYLLVSTVDGVCNIQINTNLLVIQQNINISIEKNLYSSFISKKSSCSLSQSFF